MRAALIAASLVAATPAAAEVSLALAERQVVSLEFQQPPARVSMTDPDLLRVQVSGAKVTIAALHAGRASLELAFADGAVIGYEVTVEAARRPAVAAPRPPAPNEIALAIGEERRFRSAGVARALIEENGVARATVKGELVSVVGVAAGEASLVLVDAGGVQTTWQLRVR